MKKFSWVFTKKGELRLLNFSVVRFTRESVISRTKIHLSILSFKVISESHEHKNTIQSQT
jgi:hypothetical protein